MTDRSDTDNLGMHENKGVVAVTLWSWILTASVEQSTFTKLHIDIKKTYVQRSF